MKTLEMPSLGTTVRWRAGLAAWIWLLPVLLLGAVQANGQAQALLQADSMLDQVDQAAAAGRLEQAQAMMRPVLRDHPGNAKAHFVEAELLARQGQPAGARAELAVAERLSPGLPFAHPDAVRRLLRQLDDLSVTTDAVTGPHAEPPVSHPAGLRWGILLAVLLGGLIAWLLMRMGRPRPAPPAPGLPTPGQALNTRSRPPC